MNRIFWILVFTGVLLLFDFYAFQAVKTATHSLAAGTRKVIYYIYWGINILTVTSILFFIVFGFESLSSHFRNFFITWVVVSFLSKTFIILFLLADDLGRLAKWVAQMFYTPPTSDVATGKSIARSEFLSKAGLIAGTLPIMAFSYGIVKGAHDYKIRRKKIALKNLPKEFEGLKIAQLSDIHSGSFFDKEAVIRGVQMLLNEKPDVIFFTGDLVNNEAKEMVDYIEVFNKLKAPLGVFSVLGNHDYGDYVPWPTAEEKRQNLETLIGMHRQMGWDILMNENRILEKNGEKIAIIGIENWSGKPNFPKYGKLNKAIVGTESIPVKLLLSHDPSHWRAEVLPKYKEIDIAFAGHTHGFQFGIETGNLKWSPVQWVYKEWAGLYKENQQYLYVNRGFGYLGYPGRLGIKPEIAIIELTRAV